MRDITSNIKTFFTRTYNKDNTTPYAWYNTQYKKLNEEQKQILYNYFNQKDFIKWMIIVDNVEVARPQRTMGDMPEWFRPNSMFHSFHNELVDNSFIFIIYNNELGNSITYDEVEEALKSFPDKCNITMYVKNYIKTIHNVNTGFNINLEIVNKENVI